MAKAGNPIPEGFHTITPHLMVDGAAAAIDFYGKAFGAEETLRMPGPGGKIMHSELRIGNSFLMVNDIFEQCPDGSTKSGGGSAVTIHLYVNDVDALWDRAVKAGAKVVMPLADMFWGDRYGQLEDPYGHRWSMATHKEDLTPEEVAERAAAAGF